MKISELIRIGGRQASEDFIVGQDVTLVPVPGASGVFSVVKTSPRAVQFRNEEGGSDGHGKTVWLPRKALTPNKAHTYKDYKAYSVAKWLVRKLDRYQKIALNLLAY